MKFHFYSNETMLYKNLGMGAIWKFLQQMRNIAPSLGHEIHIGPSKREQTINEYRKKCTGKDHEIPDRHRTILEINDKLVYFDQQDWHTIGADLKKVPDLFDLCIKFQYRDEEGFYDDIPFKVVPYTYFTPNDTSRIPVYRKLRKEVINNRSFKHSVIWSGMTSKTGLKVRQAINKYLISNTKKSKHGRWLLEEYYEHSCYATVGASARGIGDLCHRDIEYLGIGIPFFRKVYNNRTRDRLLPNVHYYTIGGDEVGIDKTLKHFCDYFEPNGELKKFTNEEWDQYCEITNNGIKWFNKNATPEAGLRLLIEILEENGIV